MINKDLGPASGSSNKTILSVSQLARAAKDLLETYLPLLWVEGELSNFARPSSGHWYFTLKDQRSQVRCAMFRNRNASVRFKPESGQKVLCRAKVSLYEGRGDFQLIIEHMEPAGLGDLQQQFEALKAKLEAEGLFALEHKQSLPAQVQTVGVVTSPSGAAIHDILNVLKRRFPGLKVQVYPVAVQGNEAPQQIVRAIQLANSLQSCDVLIVGRGGGSLEDLWAFNDEAVARAIFASNIPLVSAVGHEVDFSIADFVADVRAATPSAAAELVSPDQAVLLRQILGLEASLVAAIRASTKDKQRHLNHLSARLRHPGQSLNYFNQRLDQLELRLIRAWQTQLQKLNQRLSSAERSLQSHKPSRQLALHQQALKNLDLRLAQAMASELHKKREQLANQARLLNSISPLTVLQRGYAIVQDDQGRALKEAEQAQVGAKITARLHRGQLLCQVLEKQNTAASSSELAPDDGQA